MVYQTSDFRNGLKIELDGAPYTVTYFQFVKPGKGTAFTRTKLKNMLTGAVIERTFRSGETMEAADVEEHTMQFLYDDAEGHHFMNTETFDQVAIQTEVISEEAPFLTENLEVAVLYYKERPVSITLPNFIESPVVYCEPGAKGNTAQGATKPAKLASGAELQVPLFINEGDILRIDTRTKAYVGRANK